MKFALLGFASLASAICLFTAYAPSALAEEGGLYAEAEYSQPAMEQDQNEENQAQGIYTQVAYRDGESERYVWPKLPAPLHRPGEPIVVCTGHVICNELRNWSIKKPTARELKILQCQARHSPKIYPGESPYEAMIARSNSDLINCGVSD